MQPVWTRIVPPALRNQAHRIGLLLLAGYVLRVAVMPLFASQDAMTTIWVSMTLMSRNELILSNDPPPIFYIHAFVFSLFRPILPSSFVDFLTGGASFSPPIDLQINALSQPGANIALTLLKLPYLLFDLGVAILLMQLFDSPRQGLTALRLWVFNPVALYISYYVGQFDIVATFFVVLSFVLCRKGRSSASLVALGAAIAFKIFAVLLVPLYLIYYAKKTSTWKARAYEVAKVTAVTGLTFLSLVLIYAVQPPFYESANLALRGDEVNGFFGTVYYNRGVPSQALLQGLATFAGYSPAIGLSTAVPDVIIAVLTTYVLVLLGFASLESMSFDRLWGASLLVFLLIYALSTFHAQWFLWAQPLLILFVARDRRKTLMPYAMLSALFFLYIFSWDAALTTRPLTPILPEALSWPSPLTALAQAGVPPILFLALARSIFSGLSLFFVYLIVRRIFLPQPQGGP